MAILDVELNDPNGTIQSFKAILEEEETRRCRRERRAPRRLKDASRKQFSQVISDDFPEATFRRYFRMGRDSFFKLCNSIRQTVGDDEFRPEEHLDAYNSRLRGALKKSGGIICGEVRVAIYIRLMAGSSYLDLMVIFDITHRPIFESFHRVCNLESFLLVPYPQAGPRSLEDNYNYYHSNCRIRIECAFGEMVMRWGIFWRTLNFDLEQVGDVVSSAALLHNFIIDERCEEDCQFIRTFNQQRVNEADNNGGLNHEVAFAIVTDNNEPRPPGRPSMTGLRSKEVGQRIREAICFSLDSYGLTRPTQPGFKYNDCGMVYMD